MLQTTNFYNAIVIYTALRYNYQFVHSWNAFQPSAVPDTGGVCCATEMQIFSLFLLQECMKFGLS